MVRIRVVEEATKDEGTPSECAVASIEQQERHWAKETLMKRSVCDPSARQHSWNTIRQNVRDSFTLTSCNPGEDRDATLAPLP